MLVLPLAGAVQGRSEPPATPPPVSKRPLSAGDTRPPARSIAGPPQESQTRPGGPPRIVVSSSEIEPDRATRVRQDWRAPARLPMATKTSLQPALALAPRGRRALEISPGGTAWGAFRPDAAPRTQGPTGSPRDERFPARAPQPPKAGARTRKTGRSLGLVLLCCAALASAVVLQWRLSRAMRAARAAAMSAVAAPAAANTLATVRGDDDRAAAGPGSPAVAASSSNEPDAPDAPDVPAPAGAEPAALPALATASPTLARSVPRERHARSPHAASQAIDVAAAVLAAQARADAFLGARAASSVDSVR